MPLANSYQMRPSFPFIEKEDSLYADATAAPAQTGVAMVRAAADEFAAANGGDKGGLRNVQYKKKESERTATAKKNTFAYKRAEEMKEPWVRLGRAEEHQAKAYEVSPPPGRDNASGTPLSH